MAIALSLLFCQHSLAQSSENQQIVFEGSLTDASGSPIDLAGAELTFYVSANGCYLYGETSTLSGDSQGNIVHRIGGGSQVAGSPNSFTQNIFFGTITGTTSFASNNCTALPTHTRLAEVFYAAQNISATIKLGTVPYAHNSTMLNGKNAADFVAVSNDTNTIFYAGSAGQFLSKSASGSLTWTNSSLTAGEISTALGYTPASASVALTASAVTTALGYTPANTTAFSAYMLKANNLSDLASATAARMNLGLGALATKNSVTLSSSDVNGTLPAANLPSFSGDISTAVGSASAIVQGLRGVTLAATAPVSGQILYYNGVAWSPMTIPSNVGTVTAVSSANSDISVVSGSSTPILTLNSGSGANQIVKLDASARLPSVDASQITAINAANITSGALPPSRLPSFNGDITTVTGSSTVTVTKLRGFNISATAPSTNQVLTFMGGNWTPANVPTGSVTTVMAGTGLSGGPITSSGTLSVNFGTSSGTVAAGNDPRILQALQSVNNLSDITSSGSARVNLGLGNLATKNSVNLATAEVTGVLPLANGGSPWLTHANGYYTASNTAIGTSAVLTNVKLLVEGNTPSQVAKFVNNSPSGFGLRIDVAGSSPAQYALNINNASGSVFSVQNDGYVGIGTLAPTAGLNLVNDNGPATKDDIQINTFGNNTAALALQKAKGTAAIPTPLLANENIGNLRWDGYTGSGYANLVAVSGYAETDLSTSLNSFLTISTNSNGTMAERVRVNSMGKVGIGTTNPTATLTVNGSIRSISGGYEYPDGSSQTTSAFGGYEHMIASCIDQMTCTVSCSAGKKILSGGCSLAAAINRLIGSFPNTLNSWHCAANNSDTITAYAICTKM